MSLAVKYRPASFNDVVGQEITTTILQNQVMENAVKSAYLFSGASGCGKTTVARIFAKAVDINCDITEIDSASNNGVEYIRNLSQDAMYSSLRGGYKAYILDEVHMLSNSSWNALLKILEEPPEKVLFILCTTEVQKVIPTVRSRCQNFTFNPINYDVITERLIHIAEMEHIKLDYKAAQVLAQQSAGGMRTAISMLEQCASYSNTVDAKTVEYVLGITSMEKMDALSDMIIQGNKDNVTIIKEINAEFISNYINYLYERVMARYNPTLAQLLRKIIYMKSSIKDSNLMAIAIKSYILSIVEGE